MNAPDTNDDFQNKNQKQLAHLEKVSWVLMGVAGVIVIIGTIYVFRTPSTAEKHPVLLLTFGGIAMAMIAISFVLGELSDGKKTVQEAIIKVIVELAMLGLFILIANLLRK